MRTYKEIYLKPQQRLIEDSIQKSKRLGKLIPQLKIHSQEQIQCLKAGSALGAILITFAMMECSLLVLHAHLLALEMDITPAKILVDYEFKKICFKEVLQELKRRDILTHEEKDRLEDYYSNYRIPFTHGLLTKGIVTDNFTHSLMQILYFGTDERMPAEWKTIEEIIEKCIFFENDILSTLINIFDRAIKKPGISPGLFL